MGTLVNITNQKGWVPELALGANAFFYDDFDFGNANLKLPWSYMLVKKFRLGGKFSYVSEFSRLDSDRFFDNFYYGVNARWNVYKGIGVFADIALPKSLNSYSAAPNLGVFYTTSSNLMFHVKYYTFGEIGGGEYSPKYNYFHGGVSWLLLNK